MDHNHDVIANGGLTEIKWETVHQWCIVAGQVGGNTKSLLAINVDLVVINDDEFHTWLGHKLEIALGPRQASTMAVLVPGPNTLPDYVHMSRLLASAAGQGMMQFTQAVTPQAGERTTHDTGKGFDRDQILKLKDVCGVSMAKEIPHNWSVIQSMNGKTLDSYRAHLAKSIDSW
jgi:hypothetical protein